MDETRRLLLASFFAMEPPSVILKLARDAGHGCISNAVQSFFYKSCINNVVTKKYPPSPFYLSSVLKQLILAAESEGQEVLGELYEQQIALLISNKEMGRLKEAVQECYKSYRFSISESMIYNIAHCVGEERASLFRDFIITIRVSLNMLEGSTGCYAWPAGLFLSELLLSYPTIFSGQCCLEIGAGTGLSSICLAHLNTSKVIATDGNISTISNLRHNFMINGIHLSGDCPSADDQHQRETLNLVECHGLVWESVTGDEIASFGADIIIGADLIYDPACISHLVRVLSLFLSRYKNSEATPEGISISPTKYMQNESMKQTDYRNKDVRPIAFLATVIRNMDTINMFISSAHLAGLLVEDVSHTMRPSVCLPQVTSIDRSAICLHKVSIR